MQLKDKGEGVCRVRLVAAAENVEDFQVDFFLSFIREEIIL